MSSDAIVSAIEGAEVLYGAGALARSEAPEDTATAPPYSEEDMALSFAARHAGGLRYVAAWGKWFVWTGAYWRGDDTLLAFNYARRECREAAADCESKKAATAIASAKTVAAVVNLARADTRLAATVDQWDRDQWLLNTPEGVVDLKTGGRRDHRPEDFMTKVTAVGPGGDCPKWHNFLWRVTGGDCDLQEYLQRVAGYLLTGSTEEHALFFAHGTGANGKSVFISTIAGVLGGYAKTAPIETFTASNYSQHPTDLAGLRGARCVTSVETEEGRQWAESRIKQLTGGDIVSARFMRQDFFEYRPDFKIVIAGNHKPSLRSVDEAIRRRFHMIPFAVTIPPEERDHGLTEALKAEWPGILQWAIDGCLEWRRNGLNPPQAVLDATQAYLEAEDSFSTWLDDCCERKPGVWELGSVLFASWKGWAERAGESPGSMKRFAQTIEAHGFDAKRTHAGRGFSGLRLSIPSDGGSDRGWP